MITPDRLQQIEEWARNGLSDPAAKAARSAGYDTWPDLCLELIHEVDRLNAKVVEWMAIADGRQARLVAIERREIARKEMRS